MPERKVLIVDNHRMILEFLSGLLEKNGYTVKTAESGLDALEILESFQPDACFIDMIMPHIDGERLCRIIRDNYAGKGMSPVLIIISATAKESIGEEEVPGFADIFIAKGPFAKMEDSILATLEIVFEQGLEKVPSRVIGIEDIYHREITHELLVVKEHQDIILSAMKDGFLELNADNRIVYANPAAAHYVGQPESEIISQSIYDVIPLSDLQLSPDQSVYFDNRHLQVHSTRTNGTDFPSTLLILHDETEKIRVESALKEKEILLHELHHRVKNNLTMLTSLINLQKDYVADPKELRQLERLHHRIHSVSLAYHTLMTRDSVTIIDFGEYVRQLADDILHTIPTKTKIAIAIEAEEITFDIETMIPLGLIVTELFTNAVRHGYPQEGSSGTAETGTISVGLRKNGAGYLLTVANDGIPFPENVDFKNTDSLGLRLVCVLVEQLDGRIELDRSKETLFSVTFPLVK